MACMKVIYLDRLFVLNWLADYLLCLTAARICGVPLRRLRYVGSALLGAAYACAALLPGWGFLTAAPWKLVFGLVMGLIAFLGERHPLRCMLTLLAVSALFGGALWAFGGGSLSLRFLAVSFAACYAVLNLLLRNRGALPDKPRAAVCVHRSGRESRFFALRDTGNSLTDPLTNRPVLLLSPRAAEPLFGEGLLWGDAVALLEQSANRESLRGVFRLVPCRGVGGDRLLALFRPASVTVDGAEARDLLCAVSPEAYGEGFEGIIPC